jgi:hypothetical protein
MFAPSRDQVRRFFFDTWARYRAGTPLQGLETIALEVILLHPEYHAVLEAPEHTAERDYTPEMAQTNPFLHMSLHLAIEEQLSIDQPSGIRTAFEALLHKVDSRHDALHAALECLGEMVWKSQRDGAAPDAQGYLECLRRQRI